MSLLLYINSLLPRFRPGIGALALSLAMCAAFAPNLAWPAGKPDMDKAKEPPPHVSDAKSDAKARSRAAADAKPVIPDPPPPDLITPLKQEFQGKFDDLGKTIAGLRDGVDKLGQDTRVNAKSIEDLKAKLEENSILVYEHLSRGMESAEKLDALMARIADIEAKMGARAKARQQAAATPGVVSAVAARDDAKAQPKAGGKKNAETSTELKPPAAETAKPLASANPQGEKPPAALVAPGEESKPQATPSEEVKPQALPGEEAKPQAVSAPAGEEAKPADAQNPPNAEAKPKSTHKPAAEPPAPVMASPTPLPEPGEPTERRKSDLETSPWEPLAAGLLVFVALFGFTLLEAAQLESWAVPQAGLRNVLLASVLGLSYFAFGHWVMHGEAAAATDAILVEAVRQTALAMLAGFVAASILSDRLSLPAYAFVGLLLGAVVYPLLGRMAWSGLPLPDRAGWLEQWGFIDFAGGTVIHSFAAWFALAWAFRLPLSRPLAATVDGVQANASLGLLGLSVVWFGWFGLSLGHGGESPGPAPLIANTLLAGAAALAVTLPCALVYFRESEPAAVYARICAGTVGGLVAVSAGVASITPGEAVFIGALAGLAHPLAYRFLSARLIKHDAVAANWVAAHGVCGVLGTLCVGLFASTGSYAEIDFGLLGVQLGGAGLVLVYGLATGLIAALLYQLAGTSSKLWPLRKAAAPTTK